ncbi:MAG TPA: hypothetical protein VE178_15530, partial [Silvibacterium sp.]|nr:hypothetical protein [Silvibacterium sp.]
VERLQLLRALGIGPDRERRIHRARYAVIARETPILSAQHLYRFDDYRRLATLVVFAREMEAELTDAALSMFDKVMGGVRRRIICEWFSAIYEWWRISLCSTIVCCRGLRPKTTAC